MIRSRPRVTYPDVVQEIMRAHLGGVSYQQIAKKYGFTRNKVAGLIWREKRAIRRDIRAHSCQPEQMAVNQAGECVGAAPGTAASDKQVAAASKP